MKKKTREIVHALKEDTGLFRLFEEEDLEQLAPYLEQECFAPDTIIFSEGDPPDYVAFVKKGKVEVRKETEFHGKQIIIAQMSSGSVLGEIALLDEEPRSATAVAKEETELLILRREALDAFSEAHPALGIKLLKGIGKVLSIRLRQLAERLVVIF